MKFLHIICVSLLQILYPPQVTDGQVFANTAINLSSIQQPADGLVVSNDIATKKPSTTSEVEGQTFLDDTGTTAPTQQSLDQAFANDTSTKAPSTDPPDNQSLNNGTDISASSTKQPDDQDLANDTSPNAPSTDPPDNQSLNNGTDISASSTKQPDDQDLANDTGTKAPSTEPPDVQSLANGTDIGASSTRQPDGQVLANDTEAVAFSIQQPPTTPPSEDESWRNSTYRKPNWEWKDIGFIVTIKEPAKEDPLHENLLHATSTWSRETCISFLLSPDDGSDLVFRRGEECTTDYGTPISSRVIHVNDSCISKRHVNHYLGHYLGLIDEQRRPDRDEYLQLVQMELSPPEQKLMTKFSNPDVSQYNTEYDFSSIMHIEPRSVDEGSKAIFRTKDPRFRGIPGRNFNPTHRDYFRVNSIHGCPERQQERCQVPANTCKNGGFLTSWCVCNCPPGTLGNNCETLQGDYYDNLMSTCRGVVTENGTLIQSQIDATWCVLKIKAPEDLRIYIVFEFKESTEKVKASARCQGSLLSITEVKLKENNEVVICGEDFKQIQIYVSITNEVEVFYDIRNTTGPREFAAKITFREKDSIGHFHILPDASVPVTMGIHASREVSIPATTGVPSTEASAIKEASKSATAAANAGSILICFFIVDNFFRL